MEHKTKGRKRMRGIYANIKRIAMIKGMYQDGAKSQDGQKNSKGFGGEGKEVVS